MAMPLLQQIWSVAILSVGVLLTVNIATPVNEQAKPGCPSMCEEHPIIYPFGIGEGCYLDLRPEFNVSCIEDYDGGPKSIWAPSNKTADFSWVHVREIDVGESEVKAHPWVGGQCFNGSQTTNSSLDLVLPAPFSVSDTKNNFTLVGCDYLALFIGERTRFGSDRPWSTNGSATTFCTDYLGKDLTAGRCNGFGCSQIPIPSGLRSFQVELSSLNDNQSLLNHWYNEYRCGYAFITLESEFKFDPADLAAGYTKVNATLNWEIEGQSCDEARTSNTSVCTEHTRCENRTISDPWNTFTSTITGYICKCADGYNGNPYFPGGCKDVDECKDSSLNTCGNGTCHNLEGSYQCKCNSGFRNLNPKSCIPGTNTNNALKVSVGVSLGFFGLLVMIFWIFCGVKRRQARKMRERFYKKNGGLLVQQQLASYKGSVDEAAIFSEQQIKTFTNNYAEKLGEGGFGIVYKGTLPGNNLPEDKKVVAVKMSKLNAPVANSAEFGNEVILLSQVKHRNVLMLRGCCLETKTPILVYEYISQGTLYDHIHKVDGKEPLPWNVRLKIATGTAKALAYLHHSLANPIIHRDVKSMNILLDKNFEAKVSDFGASKLMEEDEHQVATAVQGTPGYLDPEYTELGILTKKSDVYSFGVVLVELLTSKSILVRKKDEQEVRKLADVFVLAVEEKRLNEILDPVIAKGGLGFPKSVYQMAELAKMCLAPTGNERPTMDKVAVELGDILVEVTGKLPTADEGGDDFKRSPMDTDRLLGSPLPEHVVDVKDYHRTMQNQSLAKPPQSGR